MKIVRIYDDYSQLKNVINNLRNMYWSWVEICDNLGNIEERNFSKLKQEVKCKKKKI